MSHCSRRHTSIQLSTSFKATLAASANFEDFIGRTYKCDRRDDNFALEI